MAQVNIGSTLYNRSDSAFQNLTGVGRLVTLFVRIAFVAGGLIVLFFILFAGISLISSAGNSNPDQAAKGKQAATAAVIGFGIIFISYWIVYFIQTVTGVIILG